MSAAPYDGFISGPSAGVDVPAVRAAVRLAAEPAGGLGQWRGVAYVDGVAEFRTIDTFDSQDAAERAARKLQCLAWDLARENASARAALANVSGGAA